MRPVQYFTEEYLAYCKTLTPDEIVEFLEAFRLMQQSADIPALITIKSRKDASYSFSPE